MGSVPKTALGPLTHKQPPGKRGGRGRFGFLKSERDSGKDGETPRQRVGRYVLGVAFMCLMSALYFANSWRTALWLASIGIVLAYIGAMIDTN